MSWLIFSLGLALLLTSIAYGCAVVLGWRSFFKEQGWAVHMQPSPVLLPTVTRTVPGSVAYLQQLPHIRERSMQKRIAFWDRPSIDALLFAQDIKATLHEILGDNTLIGLRAMKKGQNLDYFFSYPVPGQSVGKTRRELSDFFRSDRLGAAQRPDLWVSIAAIHDALQIIMEMTQYEGSADKRASRDDYVRAKAWQEFHPWLDGCYQYIQHNACINTGIIADVSWDEPSIAGNCCAWDALRKLGKVEEVISRQQVDWDAFISWFARHLQTGEHFQAFSDEECGEPAICATHHALTTISRLPSNIRSYVEGKLRFNGKLFISFVNQCWTEQNNVGGYSWTPGREPTLVHTRYALAVARSFMSWGAIESNADFRVQPTKILRFLHSTWGPDGCSIVPGVASSLFATRAALLTIKYLEILRIRGFFVFEDELEYLKLRDSFINRTKSSLEGMLEAYFDKQRNGYSGLSPKAWAL